MAMTPLMMAMRPAMNRYLGGFGEAGKSIDAKYFTVDETPELQRTVSETEAINAAFGSGDVVLVDGIKCMPSPVVATIIRQADDSCDVKIFCADTGEIKTESGVKASQIRRVST